MLFVGPNIYAKKVLGLPNACLIFDTYTYNVSLFVEPNIYAKKALPAKCLPYFWVRIYTVLSCLLDQTFKQSKYLARQMSTLFLVTHTYSIMLFVGPNIYAKKVFGPVNVYPVMAYAYIQYYFVCCTLGHHQVITLVITK